MLVCDTCAKQHWKTSTGAIGKKNTSNLKCRLEENKIVDELEKKKVKNWQVGKLASRIRLLRWLSG